MYPIGPELCQMARTSAANSNTNSIAEDDDDESEGEVSIQFAHVEPNRTISTRNKCVHCILGWVCNETSSSTFK